MMRIAIWDRPIRTGSQRLWAWLNMIFVDHGIFRIFYLNKHQITSNFWRAAQPTPGQIRVMSYQGIKTIVNLRGGREHGSWPLEKETCFDCRITLMEFILRSRGAPDRESLIELPAFFDSLTYPVLVHCKSGADRAGLMAALYMLVHERKTAAEAAKQLSYWYGHFRFAKTGILDAFIEEYARNGEAKGIHFMDWVKNYYDPAALEANFKSGFFSRLLVDRVLKRE